jgi:biotin operon repressor
MRADRLLSLIMLLQSRSRMTARSLAIELEVSERTIYRDIQALSVAGIPVYGEGGFSLLGSYRTSLTGLTPGEVRALFMLSIPTPAATHPCVHRMSCPPSESRNCTAPARRLASSRRAC